MMQISLLKIPINIVGAKSLKYSRAGIEYLWKEALVLVIMTTFFLLVSAKKYKVRL